MEACGASPFWARLSCSLGVLRVGFCCCVRLGPCVCLAAGLLAVARLCRRCRGGVGPLWEVGLLCAAYHGRRVVSSRFSQSGFFFVLGGLFLLFLPGGSFQRACPQRSIPRRIGSEGLGFGDFTVAAGGRSSSTAALPRLARAVSCTRHRRRPESRRRRRDCPFRRLDSPLSSSPRHGQQGSEIWWW